MTSRWPRLLKGVLTFVTVVTSTLTTHAQFLADQESGDDAELFPVFAAQYTELPAGVGQPLVVPGLLTIDASQEFDTGIALTGYSADCDSCDSCSSKTGCSSCGGCCNSCQCPLPNAPCLDCPRISTQSPYFNINVFGALKLDMLFNESRPLSPGTPFFLLPKSIMGFDEQTFDIHARQSTLGASLAGPQFGGFQSGGMLMAVLYNDAVIVDQ